MTNENFETLVKVFNTLLLIETKGENTLAMAECLKALQQVMAAEKPEAFAAAQAPAETEEE